ncbi:MAG: hypothetical protein LBP69_07060, partial [Treponema sp.]|nr:hypothetical protein [Treponema sp.]
LERRGIFRLYEGTVSRNVAGFGDAVMVVRGAAFEMYGGEMTLPAAEQRGIVVLQGMDIMRVHTPSKQIVAGSKSPQRGGVWTRLRIKDSEEMPVIVEAECRFEKSGGDIDGRVIRLTDDN